MRIKASNTYKVYSNSAYVTFGVGVILQESQNNMYAHSHKLCPPKVSISEKNPVKDHVKLFEYLAYKQEMALF